jgi:polyferredoxin
MFVYAAVLLLLTVALVTSMVTRTPVILDVIRDRNTLYRELPGDIIENSYTIKVYNQLNEARDFHLSVAGVPGLVLDGVADAVTVEGGGVLSLPVRARTQRDNAYGIMNITFTVTAVDDENIAMIEDSRFLGPTP